VIKMSMIQTVTKDNGITSTKSVVLSEIAQMVVAIGLMAIYVVEIINKVGNSSFIAGALISVVGYYFGGKVSTQSALAATTAATNSTNAATTPTNGG